MKVTVYGVAQPKGSARGFPRRDGGVTVVADNRPTLRAWASAIGDRAQEIADRRPGYQLEGPLAARATFYLPRPRGHYRTGANAHLLRDAAPPYPAGKPDLDKLARAAFDAVTAVWFADDSQLCDMQLQKRYAEQGQPPRLELEIERLGARGATPNDAPHHHGRAARLGRPATDPMPVRPGPR